MGKIGYTEIENRAGRRQYWLTMGLRDGWLAAFQLTHSGEGSQRCARILELRVVPNNPAGFDFLMDWAWWDARERAQGRTPPAFSFEALRREITARHFGDALAAMAKFASDDPDDQEMPAERLEPRPPRSRARGRPARPRAFYAKFAVQHEDVEHVRRRDRGESTRLVLAKHYKVPVTTVGKWIRIARQLGFLTQVRPGQRGGRPTNAARRLAEAYDAAVPAKKSAKNRRKAGTATEARTRARSRNGHSRAGSSISAVAERGHK